MIHFTDQTRFLMDMSKEEKKTFLKHVDLFNNEFTVKIADFGLSRKVRYKESKTNQFCGTLTYMAP